MRVDLSIGNIKMIIFTKVVDRTKNVQGAKVVHLIEYFPKKLTKLLTRLMVLVILLKNRAE